jgi:hypothetical protein
MAIRGVMVSLAGLAVIRFPATVARLRKGFFTQERRGSYGIMGHERTDVYSSIFIQGDAVEVRQAGDVDHGLDALPNAALELEHQVCRPCHQPGFLLSILQDIQNLIQVCRGNVVSPHAIIKPQSSARCHLALLLVFNAYCSAALPVIV